MKKRIFVISIAVMVLAALTGCGSKVELTEDMDWYRYDPENIWGISATVVDNHRIIYVFDADKCLFTEDDVDSAFSEGQITGCTSHAVKDFEVKSASYEKDGDTVYLILEYPNKQDMSEVGGFRFYLSEDEWLSCHYTEQIMHIHHVVVNERHYAGEPKHEWDEARGDDWTQSWNLEDSGKWSKVTNEHYYWDMMPLE